MDAPEEPRVDHELLYVHPWGHLNDLVIPSGVLSCVNAAEVRKLGRYAFEVTEAEIRAARVVAIDVHWALALNGFGALVHFVRSVAPSVPIVVGGITAGHMARQLLDEHPVDFVVRGDSEVSFGRLVRGLCEGELPTRLPNVFTRSDRTPALLRMTPAEFDATDCITATWFPTYELVSRWDARAFPQGRLIPLSRGCPLRCEECYGSYASTFGSGYLLRSPAGAARLTRQAAQAGARNLRYFVGKPSVAELSALIGGLAEGGPYTFDSAVGFYVCRAPSEDDLHKLEQAFRAPVVLSMIPPDEHQPPLPAERLLGERSAWQRVTSTIERSTTLRLDAWVTQERDTARARTDLTADGYKHINVSNGAVWSMTRPTDGGAPIELPALLQAVSGLWSFHAARLLSPTLATLLQPFRLLDEIDDLDEYGLDAGPRPSVSPSLGAFRDEIARQWRANRLPTLPSLRLALLPVSLRPAAPLRASSGEFRWAGALGLVAAADVTLNGAAITLTRATDHRGERLQATLPALRGSSALAFVPHPLEGALDAAWLREIGELGLVIFRLPAGAASSGTQFVAHLRIQDFRVHLLDEAGESLARGVAHCGYISPAPAALGPRPGGARGPVP